MLGFKIGPTNERHTSTLQPHKRLKHHSIGCGWCGVFVTAAMFIAEKIMKIILTVLLCFIYHAGVEGKVTITSLGCESANGLSSHLTVGREYTMYCSITSPNNRPVIVWMIAPNSSITVIRNTVASVDSFTARLVKSDGNSIIASLTFTATASLDQKIIACQDSPIGVSLIRDECRLQIGNFGFTLKSTRSRSTTSNRAGPNHTLPVTSIGAKSTSTVLTTSTRARSTSTVLTTSTRAGSTSTVLVISTRAGSTSNVPVTSTRASTASFQPRPTLATTTLSRVWSTVSSTSKTTSLTPVTTNTVSPTSGKRIVNVIVIPVVAVTVVIAIITGICLLSICVCKKRLFRKYGNSHDHSNPASHIQSTNEDFSVPPPPVYDIITMEPKMPSQSPDLQRREYTMYCSITGPNNPPVVAWIIAPNYSITIVNKNTVASVGGFTARVVNSDGNSITSSLTFTATASLDQKVIVCQDSPIGVSLIRDECRIQIGNPGSSFRSKSITSTKAESTPTVPAQSTEARSSSNTKSTQARSTSTISTTSTQAGSTSIVSKTGSTSTVSTSSFGPRPTLATTTLPTVIWSTVSSTPQTTLLTPVATNTASPVSPTSGKRIVNIIVIPVVAVTVVNAIITGICLLSICICKKRPFRKNGNSHDHSNPISHIELTNQDISIPPPPVYDYITVEPNVLTQPSDLHNQSTNESISVLPLPGYDNITIEPKVPTQSPGLQYEEPQPLS
uniref:Ig-like domain-containing protein n=1 Tax=Amphimedon queenslandica TaxID=400682 RepID=A0A1X7U1Q8_AMPQE